MRPEVWGPAVSGTNEEGETYDSNIIKEAQEEIGLTGYTLIRSYPRAVEPSAATRSSLQTGPGQ